MAEELEGWGATDAPVDGYASEGELDTHKLICKKNKKNKKSGGFQSMGLSSPVFRGVLKKGYKVPTPIQRKTIPLILEGKDVVAMARTGSGKTACFLIPLFEKLQCHSAQTGARALILSPTRELAIQTLKFTKELGKFTDLRAAVVLGGDSLEGQFAALHENPDIIIATPGRLVHVCIEMNLKLQSIQYVVFDEADRLYEMGFAEQLSEILGRLPETRQTLLFSATLPKMLVEFARAGLTEPVLIRLDAEHVLSENLKLAFFKCNTDDKLSLLLHVLQHIIRDYEQTVIFTATRHHVEYLHQALDLANIPNTHCYSALDPSARKINVAKFRTRKVRCLLVTDVAARGIDIPLLDNVINFNFPGKPKLFVHRVGRVARAGRAGVAYSFIAPDEASYLLDLHLFLSKEMRVAPHPPDESTRDDWNYVYGSVPQAVLDNEAEHVLQMHRNSADLDNAKTSSINAYKQYSKSRPASSMESVKRMKENEWVNTIGYHPLLMDKIADMEHQRLALLHSLKNLQPKGTIFEIIKTRKAADARAVAGMKEKREYDGKRIEAFHRNLEARQTAKKEREAIAKEVADQVGNMEKSTEDEVKKTFLSIISKNQKKGEMMMPSKAVKKKYSEENRQSIKKRKVYEENQSFKEKEFYIPYTKNNEFTEQGFSVGNSFHHAAEATALDLVGDDEARQRQTTALHKWDRYKRKFVGTQSQQKRIKTESGVWIPASYKTDRYQKWIAKGKTKDIDDSSDDDGGSGLQGGPSKKGSGKSFQAIRKPSYGKTHPLLKGKVPVRKRPPKRELRTEDEIIKETKRKQSERKKHAENLIKKRVKMSKRQKHDQATAKKERAKMDASNMKKQQKSSKGKGRKK